VNCFACTSAFCPVVESRTSRIAIGDAADLLELLDQVDLVVEPAGRVGQHQIVAPCRGPLHRVEDDRARVAAFGAADDVHPGALGPHTQLISCGGSERVPGGEQDGVAGGGLLAGQLADRGRLPDAVDPDDEPHVDRTWGPVEAQLAGLGHIEQRPDGIAQSRQEVRPAGDLPGVDARPEFLEERRGGLHPDIGPDQRLFERIPGRCVDLAAAERRDGAAEDAPDNAQTAAIGGGFRFRFRLRLRLRLRLRR
jgi:hypothetical protein